VITTDVRALAIAPNGHVFAGTYQNGGVFRSNDDGDSWTPVNTGLTCGNVVALAVNASGDLFAGTTGCGAGVFRSTDDGDHWELVNAGLTSTDVTALAVASNGHLFAGTVSQFGVGGGVFRSIDNGDTWTPAGLDQHDVNALTAGPYDLLFAGVAGGVFESRYEGYTWDDVSAGLVPPGGNVWALATDSAYYAYAATAGGGVMRSASTVAPPPPPPPPPVEPPPPQPPPPPEPPPPPPLPPPPPPPPPAPPQPPPPPAARCHVPGVLGLTLGRAKQRIRTRHCSVGRIRRAHSRRVGRVIAQSPRSGAVKSPGFPVKLVVGRR